jgi:hypothetical protein
LKASVILKPGHLRQATCHHHPPTPPPKIKIFEFKPIRGIRFRALTLYGMKAYTILKTR